MSETKIEWTERTWNPIVGCTVHSPGCKNCYAMRMAARLEAMAVKSDGEGNPGLQHYVGTTEPSRRGAVWTGKIGIAPDDAFTAPLRRKKPTDYFVNSMSDLFHVSVPFEVVDRVFAVMSMCKQHTFKILTKRSDRMREYLTAVQSNPIRRTEIYATGAKMMAENDPRRRAIPPSFPLPNVWLGVSVEDQTRADERIPDLLNTPAALRWLSCEPLLEPVDLTRICLVPKQRGSVRAGIHIDALTGRYVESGLPYIGDWDVSGEYPASARAVSIDWVICGGESGPGSRPMDPSWARSLRDQCAAASVPFHFKQWGEWAPRDMFDDVGGLKAADMMLDGTRCVHGNRMTTQIARVGKKRAARLLDGVEHNSFPSIGEGGQ